MDLIIDKNKIYLKEVKSYLIILLMILTCIFKLEILAFILMAIYILDYINDKEFMIKYAYVIFLICSNIGGVLAIELSKSSFYLYEIAQMTYQSGALGPIILAQMITLEGIKIFERKYGKKVKCNKFCFTGKSIKYICIGIIFIISIMLLKVINKPFFMFGYDRFAYQKDILSSIEIKIGNMLLWLSPLFYILIKNKNKKLGILGIILFNFYFFWIGHKFSLFFMGFQLGFIVLVDNIDYINLKKYFTKLIKIFVVMIVAVSFQSIVVQGRSFSENIDYFKVRLAQQGQLWWGVYKEDNYHNLHLDEAKKEAELFFTLKEDEKLKYNLGMFKVMRLVAPNSIVDAKINQGSRYAYSTQASILYYFNYPILIVFNLFLGIGLAYITNLFIKYINEKNVIGVILLAKLWVTYTRMLSNSDFDTIFSLENVVIIFILIFIKILPRKKLIVKYN